MKSDYDTVLYCIREEKTGSCDILVETRRCVLPGCLLYGGGRIVGNLRYHVISRTVGLPLLYKLKY